MSVVTLFLVIAAGFSAVVVLLGVLSIGSSATERYVATPPERSPRHADADDLDQLLAVTNERRRARGLPARTALDVQVELLDER